MNILHFALLMKFKLNYNVQLLLFIISSFILSPFLRLTSPPFHCFPLNATDSSHKWPWIQTSNMTRNGFKHRSVNIKALVCASWLPQYYVAHHLLISAPHPSPPPPPLLPTRYTHSAALWALIGCGWTARHRAWIWLDEGWKQVVVEKRELKGRGGGRCIFFKRCERSPLSICNHKIVGAGIKLWISETWIMTAGERLDINDLHLWFLIFFWLACGSFMRSSLPKRNGLMIFCCSFHWVESIF